MLLWHIDVYYSNCTHLFLGVCWGFKLSSSGFQCKLFYPLNYLLSPGLTFYMGSGNPNLDLHTFVESTLLMSHLLSPWKEVSWDRIYPCDNWGVGVSWKLSWEVATELERITSVLKEIFSNNTINCRGCSWREEWTGMAHSTVIKAKSHLDHPSLPQPPLWLVRSQQQLSALKPECQKQAQCTTQQGQMVLGIFFF